jgi:hypothetical protein
MGRPANVTGLRALLPLSMPTSIARRRNAIMCDVAFKARVLERQQKMFARAPKYGWPLSTIAKQSGFHPNTVSGWANGGSSMDMWAFARLCLFLPDELTSVMLEPAGKSVVSQDLEPMCLDELAATALEFVASHARARHPDSPGGIRIVHSEEADLREKAGKLRVVAGRAEASGTGG